MFLISALSTGDDSGRAQDPVDRWLAAGGWRLAAGGWRLAKHEIRPGCLPTLRLAGIADGREALGDRGLTYWGGLRTLAYSDIGRLGVSTVCTGTD